MHSSLDRQAICDYCIPLTTSSSIFHDCNSECGIAYCIEFWPILWYTRPILFQYSPLQFLLATGSQHSTKFLEGGVFQENLACNACKRTFFGMVSKLAKSLAGNNVYNNTSLQAVLCWHTTANMKVNLKQVNFAKRLLREVRISWYFCPFRTSPSVHSSPYLINRFVGFLHCNLFSMNGSQIPTLNCLQ